ncbi:glycosyltransferase [Ancylobacter sp. 6x-1]|uniref:Glycosyltransferase n=2 Tax=Ancylobacter crimeensis TaxID=2579147 RepID=A0ABT0D6Q0_9HYPH|nr:glycosyltransferase [Ancylobacter crimeensis]MCK0195603.1 glycosyltransferase [Ancylobacter crimeensis]
MSVSLRGGGPIEGLLQQQAATAGTVHREIATLDVPGDPELAGIPIPVHALGERRGGLLSRSIRRRSTRIVPWLRDHVGDYDAVIVEGLWNYAIFAAARVLPGSGIPYVVFPHGMLDPWFRRTYPVKHAAKQLSWAMAEGPLLAGASCVLFTTEEERRLARNAFVGHQSYRSAVVGYGIGEPPPATGEQIRAFRMKVPTLDERPFLLFLSRLHEKKGCDLLVDAFARIAPDHPHLDLVIAGPDHGGLQGRLGARARELGIERRIHWPGMLVGDAKWGAFRESEAFILPSHQENFGVVVAEAMACGKAVLISDKVNIWREVEAAGAGLVAGDTLDGTVSLLQRYLALDPAQRETMGRKARQGFLENFEVRTAAASVIDVIKHCV